MLSCSILQAADMGIEGIATTLRLTRGDAKVYFFTPKTTVRSVVVFGSGDGGWTFFEKRICARLAAEGFLTLGWNCRAYAHDKYTAAILGKDVIQMIAEARKRCAIKDVPVILGGYSTGAEQSVAAAATSGVRALLKGLLLVAPGKRGRYGLTLGDLMMMTPKGPDTFALSDFAPALANLRTVQIHGGYDPLDSTTWLEKLKAPIRLMNYPNGWHRFNGADESFLKMVNEGVQWLLSDKPVPPKEKP